MNDQIIFFTIIGTISVSSILGMILFIVVISKARRLTPEEIDYLSKNNQKNNTNKSEESSEYKTYCKYCSNEVDYYDQYCPHCGKEQ